MQIKTIFLALLFSGTSAFAGWQVTVNKDAMTDMIKKSAQVTNSEGHSFTVYRHSNGSVWANFAISNKSMDQLSAQKPPIFRVDKNVPHDIFTEKKLQESSGGIQAYSWEPKWVNFVIWHGQDAEGRSKTINELMQGTSLVFRYYLFTGGSMDTTFDLANAGPAIAEALDIPIVIDPLVAKKTESFNAELFKALSECKIQMKNYRECSEKIRSCVKNSDREAEKFGKCLLG